MERALPNDCFALPPGVTWTPVETALDRLRTALSPMTGIETCALAAADGRILARAATARRANPPTANAAVDGYGFALGTIGDVAAPIPLAPGRAAAGHPFAAAVPPGHALRILTGAALPAGVDTVVLQEEVEASADTIRLTGRPKPGANCRKAGEDVAAGAPLFAAGHRLTPPDLALLAATWVGEVSLHRPLQVGVLSTGDELLPAEASAARPDQIVDANRPMLLSLVARWGMAPRDLGAAPDRAEAVRAALDQAVADGVEAILTSGGASDGDEDHLSRLLRAEGTVSTWRIAMKPGRPLALGLWRGRPVFGLPGNPVAAFVCALIFAAPALRRLAGEAWPEPQALRLPAAFSKTKKAGRREYLRARLTPAGGVETFGSEGSGRISGLAWADGLVELPEPALTIAPGDPVRYLPFSGFGL